MYFPCPKNECGPMRSSVPSTSLHTLHLSCNLNFTEYQFTSTSFQFGPALLLWVLSPFNLMTTPDHGTPVWEAREAGVLINGDRVINCPSVSGFGCAHYSFAYITVSSSESFLRRYDNEIFSLLSELRPQQIRWAARFCVGEHFDNRTVQCSHCSATILYMPFRDYRPLHLVTAVADAVHIRLPSVRSNMNFVSVLPSLLCVIKLVSDRKDGGAMLQGDRALQCDR
ncbi:hypothetical protein EJ05DRAFT_324839 [Pseudovirgaria hyperparasitica]|uniref:Uncharacterized protein n=1 Tax=Pseudovirgaria hyperparasitica TaxID=470096 RepID=A0A6A6W899_9PEZI|nr:uncharacterized protein EJ05DRAFT_324839 [Pseudovirgaria hyperparasitica]KAF2758873.1 hypothetical protein EJ05DRAFT_324839 [Pseudovirgaria hyperparasitica]